MIKITSNNKLHFDLVQEALTNHGFKFDLSHGKKFKYFGEMIYTVTVDYVPSLDLLRHLLVMAEENQDYLNAKGIKKMIDRFKN